MWKDNQLGAGSTFHADESTVDDPARFRNAPMAEEQNDDDVATTTTKMVSVKCDLGNPATAHIADYLSSDTVKAQVQDTISECKDDNTSPGVDSATVTADPTDSGLPITRNPKIDQNLASFKVLGPKLATELETASGDGSIPTELRSTIDNQLRDVVGVLYSTIRNIERQLQELANAEIGAVRVSKEAKAYNKARTEELEVSLEVHIGRLEGACLAFTANGFVLPEDTSALPKIGSKTPIAAVGAEESVVSQQQVLGTLYLAKHTKVGGRAGEKQIEQLIQTALRKYDESRSIATARLVPLILEDVAEYESEYQRQIKLAGNVVLTQLEELATNAHQSRLDDGDNDPLVPIGRSLVRLLYARAVAAVASTVLYVSVCAVVAKLNFKVVDVVPGGLKKYPRMVFKGCVNYGGDFSKIRDISRITVVVQTLVEVAAVVTALSESGKFVIVRCKNRFSAKVSVLATGGYRDFQILALLEVKGFLRYCEIQVNLDTFIALKESKTRGHGAFNEARSIQAYSDTTVVYSGEPSPRLWKQATAGMYLSIDLTGSELSFENMNGADTAMASPKCRVNRLRFAACGVERKTAETDAAWLGTTVVKIVMACRSLRFLDMSDTAVDSVSKRKIAAAVKESALDIDFKEPYDPKIRDELWRGISRRLGKEVSQRTNSLHWGKWDIFTKNHVVGLREVLQHATRLVSIK